MLIHLAVLTRSFDATDLLFRMIGLVAGIAVAIGLWPLGERRPRGERVQFGVSPRLARFGFFGTALYIGYTGVIPFIGGLHVADPAKALAAEAFLPFRAYFHARFDVMMVDVMEKFVMFGILAALLIAGWPKLARVATHSRIVIACTMAVLGSAIIEVIQMLIPVRVTSLTDPILAAGGAAVGVIAYEQGLAFYRFAAELAVRPQEGKASVALPTPFSPTDALIASLMEPAADAPKEPQPRRKPTRHR